MQQHFLHKLSTNTLAAVIPEERYSKRWSIIIYMPVVIHYSCPHSTDHFASILGNNTVIGFAAPKIFIIQGKLRLFYDIPVRWIYIFRNIYRFVQKILQKIIFTCLQFTINQIFFKCEFI